MRDEELLFICGKLSSNLILIILSMIQGFSAGKHQIYCFTIQNIKEKSFKEIKIRNLDPVTSRLKVNELIIKRINKNYEKLIGIY